MQAEIDKARKRVGELAIELGEKLYPLMRHIYTSSSAFLRVLNVLVDFIIEHRKAIGGGCRHLHLLTVSVKSGGKSHDFRNCHFGC